MIHKSDRKSNGFRKAKAIETSQYTCSECDDLPEYCHDCLEGLDEDSEFYCDGFGEHLCNKCFKKRKLK